MKTVQNCKNEEKEQPHTRTEVETFFKTWPISHFRNQVKDYCVIFDRRKRTTHGTCLLEHQFNVALFSFFFSHSLTPYFPNVVFFCIKWSVVSFFYVAVLPNWPSRWMRKMDHKSLISKRDFSDGKFHTMIYSTNKHHIHTQHVFVWLTSRRLKHYVPVL